MATPNKLVWNPVSFTEVNRTYWMGWLPNTRMRPCVPHRAGQVGVNSLILVGYLTSMAGTPSLMPSTAYRISLVDGGIDVN